MASTLDTSRKLVNFFKKHLLYLILISFVFIVSTSFSTSGALNRFKTERAKLNKPASNFTSNSPVLGDNSQLADLPILKLDATFPIVSAQSVLALDLDSGISLYEKNPDEHLLPASTTKIITALVAMDYYSKETVITVGDVNVVGQKMRLVAGEEIAVESLLYGLLVFSANDAAEVLAENYPGGRNAFVAAMNAKASVINLENSEFTNPTGLDGNGHRTTARDLTRAAAYAMQDEYFSKIVGTKEITVKSTDGKFVHMLVSTNELLESVDGVLGTKTGWTENARENLVIYLERDGHRIVITLLGSQDRFGETRELIDWIFENYEWEEVENPRG